MRFWILALAALAVVMVAFMPLTATAQAPVQVHEHAYMVASQPVQPAEVVARGIVLPRISITWKPIMHRTTIARPRVVRKPREIWTVRRYGIRPFDRTWIYHRLE